MTDQDRVLGLLAEANPISDPHAFASEMPVRPHLGTIEQWSGTMTETELRTIEPPTRRTNQRWLIAAAAAVIALVVGVGALVVVNRQTSPTAEDAAASQATMTPAETIQAYIDAYNVADIDAVMAFFTEESVVRGHPTAPEARGLAAIREIHSEVASGVTYAILISEVRGDTVTWNHIWTGFEDDGSPFRNCVNGHSATVRDGKIVVWEWPPTDFQCR